MKIKLRLLLACCFSSFLLQGQDIHFSNNQFAPLYLNPANTGSFLGSYRLSGIARDQGSWGDYQTQFLSVDTPLNFGLKDHHWVGGGIGFYNDQAGDVGSVNTGIVFSAAYHWALDTKYDRVITLGAQYGTIQRKANRPENSEFGDEQFTGGESQDFSLLNGFTASYSDVNVGILFSHKISKENSWKAGIAVYHAINKDFRFQNGTFNNKIEPRFNIHASYRSQVGRQFSIEPTFYFSGQSSATNIAAQFNTEYRFTRKTDNALLFGLGCRVSDALQMMAGIRYQKWLLGMTYDMTVSSAASYNNSFGGIEIGLQRVFTVFKKAENKPSVLCPRF